MHDQHLHSIEPCAHVLAFSSVSAAAPGQVSTIGSCICCRVGNRSTDAERCWYAMICVTQEILAAELAFGPSSVEPAWYPICVWRVKRVLGTPVVRMTRRNDAAIKARHQAE